MTAPSMSSPPKQSSLLDELDQRQNDVLLQLDELNAQVEQLLNDYTSSRQTDESEQDVADAA